GWDRRRGFGEDRGRRQSTITGPCRPQPQVRPDVSAAPEVRRWLWRFVRRSHGAPRRARPPQSVVASADVGRGKASGGGAREGLHARAIEPNRSGNGGLAPRASVL